jgi:hypothetical protein
MSVDFATLHTTATQNDPKAGSRVITWMQDGKRYAAPCVGPFRPFAVKGFHILHFDGVPCEISTHDL